MFFGYAVCVALMATMGFVIINQNKKLDFYEAWILDLQETMLDIHSKIKQVDHYGSFETDDEVGESFQRLAGLVDELTLKVGVDVREEE